MKLIKLITAVVLLNLFSIQASSQVVETDNTFGNNGIVITDLFGKNDETSDLVVQPDGKIVVAGSAIVQSHFEFALVRYNADGSIDSTFGNNGIVTQNIGPVHSNSTAMSLQSDGKYVVCGYFDNNNFSDAVVARFNVDGSVDSTFGTNGHVEFMLSNGFDDFYDMAIQPDGKIVAGGRMFKNNSYDMLLVRLNTDGSVDSTFGTAGMVTEDLGGANDCIFSLMLVANGDILVSGNREIGVSYFMSARFKSNGMLDMGFGSNGTTVIGSGNRLDKCYAMSLQSDSSIVLAGTHHNSSLDEYQVIRLNHLGNPDTTFGVQGFVLLPTVNSNDVVNDMLVQYDDRILLAGSGQGQQPVVIRLNANGDVDQTFGTNGMFAANTGSSVNGLSAITMLPDSSLLMCGFSFNGIDNDFLLSKALVDFTSGISDVVNEIQLNIYPNPATEYLNIDLPTMLDEPGVIKIYSQDGKNLLQQKFHFLNSPVKIGLPNLKPGVYYLQISSGSNFSAEQFIVQ